VQELLYDYIGNVSTRTLELRGAAESDAGLLHHDREVLVE
jgi:hypothetical protein